MHVTYLKLLTNYTT